MATRSISISLDEHLLAAIDARPGANRRNRSAVVSEALELWLQHQHLAALNRGYADLAAMEAGDITAATQDAAAMGAAAWIPTEAHG